MGPFHHPKKSLCMSTCNPWILVSLWSFLFSSRISQASILRLGHSCVNPLACSLTAFPPIHSLQWHVLLNFSAPEPELLPGRDSLPMNVCINPRIWSIKRDTRFLCIDIRSAVNWPKLRDNFKVHQLPDLAVPNIPIFPQY
jgi:hypothetical protein